MAAGMGMSFISVNIAATSGVHAEQTGLASGMLNTSQQMGGALGLAILSGVASSVAEGSGLDPVSALVAGDKRAFLVASLFAGIAFLIATFVIHGKKQTSGNAAPTEVVSAH
jgi:sugar phosphate permease